MTRTFLLFAFLLQAFSAFIALPAAAEGAPPGLRAALEKDRKEHGGYVEVVGGASETRGTTTYATLTVRLEDASLLEVQATHAEPWRMLAVPLGVAFGALSLPFVPPAMLVMGTGAGIAGAVMAGPAGGLFGALLGMYFGVMIPVFAYDTAAKLFPSSGKTRSFGKALAAARAHGVRTTDERPSARSSTTTATALAF